MSRPADYCHPCRGTGSAYPDRSDSELYESPCLFCVGRGKRFHPREGDRVRFIDWRAKPMRFRTGWWGMLDDAADLRATVRMRSSSSGVVRAYEASRVAVVRTAEERVADAVMGDGP